MTNIESESDNGVLCSVTPIDYSPPAMRTDSSNSFQQTKKWSDYFLFKHCVASSDFIQNRDL